MKKPSVLIVFLTVFIDLIGFGMVLPLLPIFAKNLQAGGTAIGALMASYSAMQFLFAPIWGRLSDRIGRRPVLLVSTAGAAVSYTVFAVGSGMSGSAALGVLFASRLLAGICGANITVAQAYIADITPPEDRSRRMGLIGMAFGLGFIFGPVIAGFSMKFFGVTGPGWVAAGLCAANFLFTALRLPESWRPNGAPAARRPRLGQWLHTMNQPRVGMLIWLFFLATFCFTCFETTLGLLVSGNFHLDLQSKHDANTITLLFSYCGIVGAVVQGGATGKLVRKMGEPALITLSLLLVAVSMAPMPFLRQWPAFLIVLAGLSIGSSMTRPPVFGLLSILTPANEQGTTIGVAQSMGSLARIVGPVFAAVLFFQNPAVPYLICAAVSLITALLAWRFLHGTEPGLARC